MKNNDQGLFKGFFDEPLVCLLLCFSFTYLQDNIFCKRFLGLKKGIFIGGIYGLIFLTDHQVVDRTGALFVSCVLFCICLFLFIFVVLTYS